MSHHKKPVQPKPPRDKLFVSAGHLEDPKCKTILNRAVARQPLLSHMDLVISVPSGVVDIPLELKQIIEQYTFSHARLSPADLLLPDFMNSYIRGVKRGSLVLVSAQDSLEDVIAIDGKSHLVLSIAKDTYSIMGIPGRASCSGPDRDKFYIEIDLLPDYMRSGKPGFERIRTGLRKLGEKDFIASYTDATGKAAEVVFPSTASSQTTFKPRISCTHATVSSDSELIQLHQRLNSHTFESNKVLRKRKRTDIDQLAEDTGSYVQELLEALASVGHTTLARQGDVNLLTISIDGMLHPCLAQDLFEYFSTSESIKLMSMTASTMPHAPVYRSVKRQDPNLKSKRSTAGNAERPVDSGVLDGWSLIFGPKTDDGKTRFVYVDSSAS